MFSTRIHTILPIALSILLPGLGIYSRTGGGFPFELGIVPSWIISSVVLYFLWYQLWFFWELKTLYRKWWFLAMLTISLALLTTVSYVALIDREDAFAGQFIFRISLGSILFLAIQYALRTQQNNAKLQLEKEQIQTENYRVQLKELRANIDPHFLFNSLNTLRSMVHQQHVNSEKFIMSLSDFYRQTLKYNENTTLPLEEELEVLRSYLFLMKNRNEDAVHVSIDIDEAVRHHHLPTLALQVVVENCFKHNSMTSRSPLNIGITLTENYAVRVCNNIQAKIGEEASPGSGYGLDLLRKRYELMNVTDGVRVQKTTDVFCVELKLL
jgi:sensor histidine kinase YesM